MYYNITASRVLLQQGDLPTILHISSEIDFQKTLNIEKLSQTQFLHDAANFAKLQITLENEARVVCITFRKLPP